MQISSRLSARAGIERASIVMATAANLDLLFEAGLLEKPVESSPSDIIVALAGDKGAIDAAIGEVEAALVQRAADRRHEAGVPEIACRTIEAALAEQSGANLALISVPGDYAAAEAFKALRLGLNVMLFSDNVSIADEIALKQLAHEHQLMVMGPDCGTAIIDGVPLGFANAVRRGEIGVVAASGTGLQQVACLIDRWGAGVSQAIGTGGRDLKAEVGGRTMLQGLTALAADTATKVIVLISKPPAANMARRVLAQATKSGKPVVVCFLGADPSVLHGSGIHPAPTLDAAARIAIDLSQGCNGRAIPATPNDGDNVAIAAEVAHLEPGQRFVRGVYSGGTFCYEALLLLSAALGPIMSSTPLDRSCVLADPWRSEGHTVVDLGDDIFTRGRPHPMIDNTLRAERIVTEVRDPAVAVVLFDLVLGYGAHRDPAAEIGAAVEAARAVAARDGRYVVFVASVCGTTGDPQGLAGQEARLRHAGVLLADSNAEAVRLAARIAQQRIAKESGLQAKRGQQ
jgi:succinyl-CoA synthetase alpha subunit